MEIPDILERGRLGTLPEWRRKRNDRRKSGRVSKRVGTCMVESGRSHGTADEKRGDLRVSLEVHVRG